MDLPGIIAASLLVISALTAAIAGVVCIITVIGSFSSTGTKIGRDHRYHTKDIYSYGGDAGADHYRLNIDHHMVNVQEPEEKKFPESDDLDEWRKEWKQMRTEKKRLLVEQDVKLQEEKELGIKQATEPKQKGSLENNEKVVKSNPNSSPIKDFLVNKLAGQIPSTSRNEGVKRADEDSENPNQSRLGGISSHNEGRVDQKLQPMKFSLPPVLEIDNDVDKHPDDSGTFMAYVRPNVASYYKNETKQSQDHNNEEIKEVQPYFNGLAGKFINMSPESLMLYWEGGTSTVQIALARPFQAVGTATFPGHRFILAPSYDGDIPENEIRARFHVGDKTINLFVYDPLADGTRKASDVFKNKNDRRLYRLHRQNIEFGKVYKNFTGRSWLGLYPTQKQPFHNMWDADYFGQEHWVASPETQFISTPPDNVLDHVKARELRNHPADDQPRPLAEYRAPGPYINMTLKVLSCAPRVFEIKNFLSPSEVDHIIHMATGIKLSLSTTSGDNSLRGHTEETKTRTSYNSWVKRERSTIIDAVYRRAADVMRIDESLMRARNKNERPDLSYLTSAVEDLQLVHYDKGQQYTAHHDFGYANLEDKDQSARFATLLIYLNEGMKGGETGFPRWRNGHDQNELLVTPEAGKAVLFYSSLPDGNMDDLSQHAAKPLIGGEKWLINLWTWDPIR